MAQVADVPRSLFFDWMHTLVSSGGMAQYQVNQFLRRIVRLVPRSDRSDMFAKLDQFRSTIRFPRKEPRLNSMQFETRVVDKDSAHVRMFAGECLQSIFVPAVYNTLLLLPEGKLEAEVECFLLLSRIFVDSPLRSKGCSLCALAPEIGVGSPRALHEVVPAVCSHQAPPAVSHP